MKRFLYILVVIVLLAIFGVSAFMVGSYIVESRAQKAQNEALLEKMEAAKATETLPVQTGPVVPEGTAPYVPVPTFSEAEVRDENGMLLEYAAIYEDNPDVAGWIRIDGTKINYPVMHTPEEPNYYLKRDFNHNYSDWGCIYAREECDLNEPSDNVTIYGHTMNDGSMFAACHSYIYKETWDNNSLIFFDTLKEYHVYKIFAVFKTSANLGEGFPYHQMVDAVDEADFNNFVSTIKGMSFYDTGITPIYGDKIICLSTCEYTLDNGRLVLAAVRIS